MDFGLSPQEKDIQARAREVAEKLAPVAAQIDESYTVHWEAVRLLVDAGLLGAFAPPEYGGTGLCSMSICLTREQLNRVSGHADVLFVMQGLGTTAVLFAGSEELKRRVLVPAVRGERLAALSLTEPEGGSDVGAMQTTARREGDNYVINGRKRFISNAGVAGTYLTYAKTDPSAGTRGISAFLVEDGTPGLSFDTSVEMLAAHIIGEVIYDNVVVPASNLLGEEGQGFKLSMRVLDVYRPSVGAAAVGLAQGALEEAISYGKKRVTFGQPIVKHQGIQFMLADMASAISAARLLVYRAAWDRDNGVPNTLSSSMAKLFATEMAGRVVDQSLQIHGGFGLTKRSKIERLYREERSMRIYEGTSEIQRIVIANHLLRD